MTQVELIFRLYTLHVHSGIVPSIQIIQCPIHFEKISIACWICMIVAHKQIDRYWYICVFCLFLPLRWHIPHLLLFWHWPVWGCLSPASSTSQDAPRQSRKARTLGEMGSWPWPLDSKVYTLVSEQPRTIWTFKCMTWLCHVYLYAHTDTSLPIIACFLRSVIVNQPHCGPSRERGLRGRAPPGSAQWSWPHSP